MMEAEMALDLGAMWEGCVRPVELPKLKDLAIARDRLPHRHRETPILSPETFSFGIRSEGNHPTTVMHLPSALILLFTLAIATSHGALDVRDAFVEVEVAALKVRATDVEARDLNAGLVQREDNSVLVCVGCGVERRLYGCLRSGLL